MPRILALLQGRLTHRRALARAERQMVAAMTAMTECARPGTLIPPADDTPENAFDRLFYDVRYGASPEAARDRLREALRAAGRPAIVVHKAIPENDLCGARIIGIDHARLGGDESVAAVLGAKGVEEFP